MKVNNLCALTAQEMKFSIKDFFSKCDQIRRKLQILSHLLKKHSHLHMSHSNLHLAFCYEISKLLYNKRNVML